MSSLSLCFCGVARGITLKPKQAALDRHTTVRRPRTSFTFGATGARASLSERIPLDAFANPHLVFGASSGWATILADAKPELAGTLLWLAGLWGPRWGAYIREQMQRVLPELLADFLHSSPFVFGAIAVDSILCSAVDGNASVAVATGLSATFYAGFGELARINARRQALADADEKRAFEAFVTFADKSLHTHGRCHLVDVRSALRKSPGYGFLALRGDEVLKKFIRRLLLHSRIPNASSQSSISYPIIDVHANLSTSLANVLSLNEWLLPLYPHASPPLTVQYCVYTRLDPFAAPMHLAFLPSLGTDVRDASTRIPWSACAASPKSRNGVVPKPSRNRRLSALSEVDSEEDLAIISEMSSQLSTEEGTSTKVETLPKSSNGMVDKTKKSATIARKVSQNNKEKMRIPSQPDFCTVRPAWKPMKRVLIIHCGGTFGMDTDSSFDASGNLLPGTGGKYSRGLRPGTLLGDILDHVPELRRLADLDVQVAMNMDSARVGPREWIRIARLLDRRRMEFDAFVVIHGTDTLSYTGAALSLMLAGFGRPVVLTGSQLPMSRARSDARQNLIDSVTCATDAAGTLQEFAVCFGGTLIRANRAQKTSSTAYRAFESPTHPDLARLGVDIEWNHEALWRDPGVYRPRFKLETNVIRIPVVPGCDPRIAYGDLYARGVRGAVLESFGVGNMPDQRGAGWLEWLRSQRKEGLEVYLASQCLTGPLHPELYRSGTAAMAFGAQATRRMTAETAVVKLMLCLAHQDLHPSYPLAGEL